MPPPTTPTNSPAASVSMTNKYRSAGSVPLLLGLVLFLWSAPARAQDRAPATTDSAAQSAAQTAPDPPASSTLPPGRRSADFRVSIDSDSGDGIDSVPEFIAFILLLALFVAVAAAFAGGFAAVSIFMDSGCLRVLVAALGWGMAVVAGLIVGLLVGAGFGGIGAFSMIGLFGGGLLYLAAWQQGHQRARQLSDADRLTWKRTLTGGALIGAGAGSVASLARSAGALFKGGGGGFGGGGASGAFSGAQGAAVAPGGAMALGTANANDALSDEASGGAALRAGRSAAASPTEKPTTPSTLWRFRARAAAEQWHRLRWYHGVACALIGVIFFVVFLPVGMGISAVLQNGHLLLGLTLVGVCFWAFVQFITTERFGEFRWLGVIVLLPLIAASVWLANHSTAPYGHLGLVGAGILVVALYRSSRSNSVPAAPDPRPSFEGGGASDRW